MALPRSSDRRDRRRLPGPVGPNLWLTGDLDGGGGTGLRDYEPVLEGLSDDRMVQGGQLPPGAVGAEVVDDLGVRHRATTGAGAWLIVLDQATLGDVCPVRFCDDAGKTVRLPRPPEWPRRPVPDADQPCPACGGRGWEEARALDESYGARRAPNGSMEPSSYVVCVACRSRRRVGAFFAVREDDDDSIHKKGWAGEWEPAEPEPDRETSELEPWEPGELSPDHLRDLAFPVYGQRGERGNLSGMGSSWEPGAAAKITSVTVVYGGGSAATEPRLTVETQLAESAWSGEAALARQALPLGWEDRDEPWPEGSESVVTLWLRAREREWRRKVASTQVRPHHVVIDGVAEEFQLARSATGWAAVRRHGRLLITVTGIDTSPARVELEAIGDPSAELARPP